MSLKYEPSSEPLHISAKWLFLIFLLVFLKLTSRLRVGTLTTFVALNLREIYLLTTYWSESTLSS